MHDVLANEVGRWAETNGDAIGLEVSQLEITTERFGPKLGWSETQNAVTRCDDYIL